MALATVAGADPLAQTKGPSDFSFHVARDLLFIGKKGLLQATSQVLLQDISETTAAGHSPKGQGPLGADADAADVRCPPPRCGAGCRGPPPTLWAAGGGVSCFAI